MHNNEKLNGCIKDYQDIIDFIEITIDAKQVLDEST